MAAKTGNSISTGMRPEMARARINAFRKRFSDEAYYSFAQHAAFPLALTPDLLYQLRAHFQHDIKSEKLDIPWIAIADLLLSPICEETDSGNELYEIDVTIREQLLQALQDDPRFGKERMEQLAYFLLDYIQEQIKNSDPTTLDLIQGQTWTALAYIKPEQAAHQLAEQITVLYNNGSLDQIRITSIMESLQTLNPELSALNGFQPLLTNARIKSHTFLGHTQPAGTQDLITQTTREVAAALNINLPTNRSETQGSSAAGTGQEETATISDFYISHHIADHDWAEWIARQLQAAGYTVRWGFEFGPASSLDIDTSSLRNQARTTLALLSPSYLSVDNVQQEWNAILSQNQQQKSLLPIRVRECTPQGIFASIQYVDLVGQNEEAGRKKLLQSVNPFLSADPSITPETNAKENPPIKIFISYAQRDQKLSDELKLHLALLEMQGLIRLWDYSMVPGGVEWEKSILTNLNDSEIILFLISADLLASEFAYSIELSRAMERSERGEARVIPILLRPVEFGRTPLATLQALPRNGVPVSQWDNRDEAFDEIAREIQTAAREINRSKQSASEDDASKIRELERRTQTNQDAATYVELGKLYERVKRIDDAIRAYEQARSLQPGNTDILFALSRLYNDTGRYEQAIADLNQLIELQPSFADAYKQRGLVYRRQADAEYETTEDKDQRSLKYKPAITDLERAVELRPGFEEALGSLGGIYRRQGDYERAVEYYQRLYDTNPNSSYALGNLASLSWYLGRRDEANNYFLALERASQKRLKEWEEISKAEQKEGREDVYWDYYDLALSELAIGEIDTAQKTYEKAIEETPAIAQLDAVLNNLYFLQKAPESIRGLEEIIAMIENAKKVMAAKESSEQND